MLLLSDYSNSWLRWLTHTGREVSPSGLEDKMLADRERRELVVEPSSGGLRTPAGKCRPPGL